MMALIDDPEHDLSVGPGVEVSVKNENLGEQIELHLHRDTNILGPERRGPAGKQKEEDQSPRSTAGILGHF
jgi:hypothetical protein